MVFNKYIGSQEIDLETGIIVDDSLFDCYGGGKGGASYEAPEPQPIVAPTTPVEEASVELDEEDDKKKLSTGKESLKIPLTTSPTTGLSAASGSGSGLGI